MGKNEGIYIFSNFQGYFPVFWQLKGQTVIDSQMWNSIFWQEKLIFLTMLRIKRSIKGETAYNSEYSVEFTQHHAMACKVLHNEQGNCAYRHASKFLPVVLHVPT